MPRIAPLAIVCILGLTVSGAVVEGQSGKYPAEEAAALAAVDEYFAAFNARDPERFAKSLHYPHMRIDGNGEPTILRSWQEAAARIDFDEIARRGHWARTNLDWKKVVQSGRAKVHVMVGYTRYNPQQQPIVTEQSLYVVTLHDGRWAIQMRSSYLEEGLTWAAAERTRP